MVTQIINNWVTYRNFLTPMFGTQNAGRKLYISAN